MLHFYKFYKQYMQKKSRKQMRHLFLKIVYTETLKEPMNCTRFKYIFMMWSNMFKQQPYK